MVRNTKTLDELIERSRGISVSPEQLSPEQLRAQRRSCAGMPKHQITGEQGRLPLR